MSKAFSIHYESLRNVTSPDDKSQGRTRYCGVARADQFFELPDELNVRDYLQTEVNGKPIKKQTAVNRVIRETLERDRGNFTLLNGGIVIVATDTQVDDKDRLAKLTKASIINGSQTQGVLKDFFQDDHPDDQDYPWVNFEVITCNDPGLAAEITIARNFQNAVLPVSTYGAKGLFNGLEDAMKKHDPNVKLRKSETDVGDDYIDTEKLIQIITVIVPSDVKMPREDNPAGVRAYAFSQKAVCLKDFAMIMEKPEKPEYEAARQFFLEVAHDAWRIFNELRHNQNFACFREKKVKEHSKRSPVKKDKHGNVVDVAMGVLFPTFSAMGKFVRMNKAGHWEFEIPEDFDMGDLIQASYLTFSNKQDPAKMGKETDCYLALQPIVTAYLKYRSPDHVRA